MDAVIIEAIEQRIYDVIKVETVLRKYTNGEKSLFTEKEQEELGLREEDLEIELT